MRIVFPTLVRFPSSEAPAIQVANMAQAFAELGHGVDLVVPAGPVDDADTVTPATLADDLGFTPAFSTRQLSRRIHRGQSYLHAARIARTVARDGADLVFSRNLRACVLPARRGVPTVFEAHTLTSLTGPQDRRALRWLMDAPGFRGVVAISQGLAEDLVTTFGLSADQVLVAHDAVRADTVAPPVAEAPREDAGGRLRVGYTGSLFAGRGIEQLVELAGRAEWMTLDLVGGPAEAARALVDRLAGTTAAGRVTVHGPVPPTRARTLQRSFDVLVAPFGRRVETDSGVDSSRWMSPMKVFEYMASGRPIVISDLPVLREVLRPDVDALMVPPEDLDALEGALRRLATEPGLGMHLATSARERVLAELTWETRARRILDAFVPEHATKVG